MRAQTAVFLSCVLLASCSNPFAKYFSSNYESTVPAASSPAAGTGSVPASVPAAADRAAKNGDTVAVDYVGRFKDSGEVFDASIRAQAEKSKNFNPDRDYSPLLFTVGAGQMIKGFDKGVVGMKVGEKRTLEIPPEEAYGTGGTEEVVPRNYFQDSFEETVPRDKYQDEFRVQVPATTFESQGRSVPKVGETVTAGEVTALVEKSEKGELTLVIRNTSNPFYGKKLAVGLEGTFEGNAVKITKLDDKNVTVRVDNRQNPFYGKKLAVGLEAEVQGQKYVVRRVDRDSVTVERMHALAGKTLVFDVELKEIK